MKVPVVIPVWPTNGFFLEVEQFQAHRRPEQHEWLWLSGGGCLVLNGRYALLVERSRLAPTNPLKITLATGRADTLQECLWPERVVRECFEEVQILWREQRLEFEAQPDFLVCSARDCGKKIYPDHPVLLKPVQEILVEPSEVFIYQNKQQLSCTRGFWHLNQQTREIHLLRMYNLEFLEFDLKDFIFFDTELDAYGQALHRHIRIYDAHTGGILDSEFRLMGLLENMQNALTLHAFDFLRAWQKSVRKIT